MREKYVLPADERTTISIDKEVHAILKGYAREKGISLAHAVFTIIGKGLAQERGLERERDNK